MSQNKRIVFFGTPEFAVESLKALVESGHEVAAVVTMPDKVAGRGHRLCQSDVKKYALEAGLPVLQPRNLKAPEFIAQLKAIDADLFIVIAFRMLPREVWEMPPLGTFNLHASLLPKYRGAAPINRAVMNGEKTTGVTTFFLKHEIDTGDMIEQRSIEIADDENVGSVHDRLMTIGADMVMSTVDKIFDGTVKPVPQPEGDFTPAPKIFPEDCATDWTLCARKIHNHVRGLSPYPGARATILLEDGRKLTVKVMKTAVTDKRFEGFPGTIYRTARNMYVSTGNGHLEILELQPSGKKVMDSAAFLAGYNPERFLTAEESI